jgi:hypothetical protein
LDEQWLNQIQTNHQRFFQPAHLPQQSPRQPLQLPAQLIPQQKQPHVPAFQCHVEEQPYPEYSDPLAANPSLVREIMPKLGRILGPRGLMPNAKSGTVTEQVGDAVRDVKAGQIEYRLEKESGIVHVLVGKISFDDNQIKDNVNEVMSALVKARPATAKGRYVKSVAISSTMGVSIRLEPSQFV